jgi:hypothetical protein
MPHRKIDIDRELAKEAQAYKNKHKPTKAEIAFQRAWVERTEHVCKPCWELKYCPYGPLVEQFPLPAIEREAAISYNEFLKKQLEKGRYKGWRKQLFEKEVKEFNPKLYPKKIPTELFERSCTIFGHICPVFFVNEPFSETEEMRRITRNIPRDVMLRVARRDDYTCQSCGKHLGDDEIEFHHKIPYSKGGTTDENNLQLACFDCNRSKGSKVSGLITKEDLFGT